MLTPATLFEMPKGGFFGGPFTPAARGLEIGFEDLHERRQRLPGRRAIRRYGQ